MDLTVRLFALCADLAGASQTIVLVDDNATVRGVRDALERLFEPSLVARSMIAVNAAYANDATVIVHGDEIALIPPVAGG